MKHRRVSVLAALAAVGLWNLAALGQTGNQPPKPDQPKPTTPTTPQTTPPSTGAPGAMVGKPAPEFTAKDLDGKEHKLSQHKDKIVVLEWLSSNCNYCKTHFKDKKVVQKTYDKFKDKDVVWLGVASNASEVSKPDDLKKFVKDMDLDFPVLLDNDGRIARAYGAKMTPQFFVIDKRGTIAYEGALDNDPTMKDPNAINYVEQAIQALLDNSQVATKSTKPYGMEIKLSQTGATGQPGTTKDKEKEPGTGRP